MRAQSAGITAVKAAFVFKQNFVGVLNKRGGVGGAIIGVGRNAATHAETRRRAELLRPFDKLGGQSFQDGAGFVTVGFGQDNRKLIAAIATHDVGHAQLFLQNFGA